MITAVAKHRTQENYLLGRKPAKGIASRSSTTAELAANLTNSGGDISELALFKLPGVAMREDRVIIGCME